MLFNFKLRPLEDIAPWRDPKDNSLHLHWFGLTDGWYWIDTGNAELFRYSQAEIERCQREYAGQPWVAEFVALPYADYQVVRLWEDVLAILPYALEPVPSPLAETLAPDGPWVRWEQAAEGVTSSQSARWTFSEEREAAAQWWWNRLLNYGYLRGGPMIWFWNDGVDMHIQWDNRKMLLDGVPAWEAQLGESRMPIADFIEEVRDFDRRLIRRMADRVAIAQGEWQHPEVTIFSDVAQEQVQRAHVLERTYAAIANRQPTDWNAVFQAIATIEALPAFPAEAALRLVAKEI